MEVRKYFGFILMADLAGGCGIAGSGLTACLNNCCS